MIEDSGADRAYYLACEWIGERAFQAARRTDPDDDDDDGEEDE